MIYASVSRSIFMSTCTGERHVFKGPGLRVYDGGRIDAGVAAT